MAIDDAHSTLIDISAHGAQVLSSRAIHPDSAVRLVLPSDKGGLSCNARVVWVVVEQAQDETGARYRAGLQFMDIDTPQLEAFMSRHGILELAKPATATRLVTTAAHGALPASGE